VILVVLGTHGQPFPRAIRLASQLTETGEQIVVQHGHTPQLPELAAEWRQWCPRAELDGLIQRARLVVVHGGSGCIVSAQRHGVRPLVVPRLERYGEHVDDHQAQLSKRLERSRLVVVWHDGESADTVTARLESETGAEPIVGPDLRPAVWEAARAVARR
jgi:UDP-N-acetylglucosamine transferase subunit ALG13